MDVRTRRTEERNIFIVYFIYGYTAIHFIWISRLDKLRNDLQEKLSPTNKETDSNAQLNLYQQPS
jgi:hypothetical protein